MNSREAGTMLFRVLAIYETVCALNYCVSFIPNYFTFILQSFSGSGPAAAGVIGGFLTVMGGALFMFLAAKCLWERAPALTLMTIGAHDQLSAAEEEQANLGQPYEVDWPVLAVTILGAWVVLTDIPHAVELGLNLVARAAVRATPSPYVDYYASQMKTLPTLVSVVVRLGLGLYCVLSARKVATLLGGPAGWGKQVPEVPVEAVE